MPRQYNPKPPYPAQFRQQMIELVAAGRRPSELAKEFGCHETSILSWMRAARVTEAAPPTATTPQSLPLNAAERQELIELRRRLRQVQQERDILAKATTCRVRSFTIAFYMPWLFNQLCGVTSVQVCAHKVSARSQTLPLAPYILRLQCIN